MALKVLLLAPLEKPGFTGGQARAARLLADGLRECRDVALVHVVHPHRAEARSRVGAIRLRVVFYAQFLLALVHFRPQIAHFFCPCSFSSIIEKTSLSLVAQVFGVRTLINLRNDPRPSFLVLTPFQSALMAWCLRRYHGAVCQFSSLRSFYSSFVGVPDKRIFIAHNAVSGASAPPSPKVVARRLINRRVIYVGSLQPRKGVDVLLEAIALMAPEVRPMLDVVGDPQPPEYLVGLRARADALFIESWVVFHGPRFGAEKAALFCEAAVLVLPSRAEGFPNVTLEAARIGLPVVITRVGASEDIAAAFGAGAIVVEVDDASGLADALSEALSTSESYAARSAAASAGVANFTVARMCAEMISAYKAIVTPDLTQ